MFNNQELDEFEDRLMKRLDEVFVSKNYCSNKKENYVRSDICAERTKNIMEKIEKIEKTISNIYTSINTLSIDIKGIKVSLSNLKNKREVNEEDGENKNAFIINKKILLTIITGYGLLIGTIVYLVENYKG